MRSLPGLSKLIVISSVMLLGGLGMRCGGSLSTPTSPIEGEDSTTFVDVAVGGKFACALDDSGRVYCWGGDGTLFTASTTPQHMTGVPATEAIFRMYSGVCGTHSAEDGYWCVGSGLYGPGAAAVYTFASPYSKTFSSVFGANGITFFDAFGNTFCATESNGSGKCWGLNDSGQMGTGNTTASLTPTAIVGSLTFSKIAPGASATCGIVATPGSSGPVKCWGQGTSGQIGNGASIDALTPTTVTLSNPNTASDLAGGSDHFCAITQGNVVQCWGDNGNGQIGNTGVIGGTDLPFGVTGINVAAKVYAVDQTSMAILEDETLMCWGANGQGQFGVGNTATSFTAMPCATGVSGIAKISLGTDGGMVSACALLTSGIIRCWGDNTYGQTGETAGQSVHTAGGEITHP